MRRFRIPLIIIGVLILLGLIGGGAAFYFTRGAVEAADKFFATIAETGAAAAYAQTAPAFRAATAQDDLANAAERLKLTSSARPVGPAVPSPMVQPSSKAR